MAHDVFISYATEDKSVADAVCASLESHSVRCWIAPRDVLPGTSYGEAIIEAIHACRIMVLVLSSRSNHSPHIPKEIERAVSRGISIIPFRIEDVLPGKALDYFIGSVHWLDALTPPLERHLERLAQNVETLLTRDGQTIEDKTVTATSKSVVPVLSRETQTVSSGARGLRNPWFISALAAVSLLVVVFAIWFYSRRPVASVQSDAPATDLKDKYSAAFKRLARRDVQSRIVGIRELEGIAESEQYREQVVQDLVSFVRQRVPWNEEPQAYPRPPEDVQAALLVIGRWPQQPTAGESWINLRGTDLRGAELGNLHFEHAYFSGAHLERALIRFGHFERAVLASAHLENASLNEAHFEEADLEGVHFDDAKLQGAHLEGATLGPRPNDEPHRLHLDAVGLTCDQVKSAHVDKNTVLPSYLRGSACLEQGQ
jgi:uncharacterized protein YjbI with pentapeptide repeats